MRLRMALPQVQGASYPQAFEKRHSKITPVSMAVLFPLLPLLSAPCGLAQAAHRANANLRISVNVVPVVFPVPQDHRASAWWVNPLPGLPEGIVLDSSAGPPSLTLAEEVRKLSETGWDTWHLTASPLPSQLRAEVARRLVGFSPRDADSQSVIDRPRFTGRDEAVVRTRIVVPQ
jgi:hypothetical protein